MQGLTEFLPVSSSGHLVMAGELLGAVDEGILFEIAVHVATLLAVLVFYRRRVAELVVGVLSREGAAWRYATKLLVGSIPAGLAGVLLADFFEGLFASPRVAGVALLVTGAALLTTRRTLPRAASPEPTYLQAFLVGCAQAVAIVPGISRSGSTVAAALALGVSPVAAAEFSFLLSVPAIAGAALLQIPDAAGASREAWHALLVGGAFALVSGLAALWLFVRLLRSGTFHLFAWYTFAAGGLFLSWLALRG